jgi:uncharacterized membrane protein YhaH (DUF805 family)
MQLIISRYKRYLKQNIAGVVWTIALIVLYFMEPGGMSFCLFKMAGFTSCIGCGIGQSIHHTLHLEFQQAISDHILGIPATLVIILMILKSTKNNNYGPATDAFDVTGTTAR